MSAHRKKCKHRALYKFFSSYLLLTFLVQAIFPPLAAAQMMAPAPVVSAAPLIIIPSSPVSSIMPSIMVAPRSFHFLPAEQAGVPFSGAKTAKVYVDERFHLKARGAHLRKPFSGSRIFGYNTALQPSAETVSGLYSKILTRTYATSGVIGRSTGLNTGADYSVTYGYDPTGRFNSVGWTVNGTTGNASYTYVPNSDLLATLTTGSGQLTTHTYEANRNLRTRVNNQFNAGTVSRYDYVSDGIGRRTSVANSGSAFSAAAFNRFNYNLRSELAESARYLGTDINNLTQPVTPEYRGFNYDPIGNRTNITVAASSGSYTANNLNQYSLANLPGGGSNTFTHDLDGNLTTISGAKNVIYTYDAENRLITAQPTAPVAGDKKLDFTYDYQGRRVRKIVSNWNGASWVPETTKYFVYDGWNVVEEQTVAQPSRYYVWGLDLSQSLQGAGGIGGLLARVESTTTHNFLHDGNGNVTQLINATTGTTDAHYEYDPYGNAIVATGTQAAANPYRFSAKYLDGESGLYYYGYRYYDPGTGRWLSRDPEGELDGANTYAFLSNNGINLVDYLGLRKILNRVAQIVGGQPTTLQDNSGYLNRPPLSWILDDHQAVKYGWAWLLGIAPETTYFNQNSQMVNDILDHEGIKKAREVVVNDLKTRLSQNADYDISRKVPNYSLGGVMGVFKYLRDYSVIFTGGKLGGNLTATFLGSYRINPVIVSNIDRSKCTAEVYFSIKNTSGWESGTRFPVTGYIGNVLDLPTVTIQDIFNGRFGIPSGALNDNTMGRIGQNADQVLHWGEEVKF